MLITDKIGLRCDRQSCTNLAYGTFNYNDAYCIYNTSATYPTMVSIVKEIKAADGVST